MRDARADSLPFAPFRPSIAADSPFHRALPPLRLCLRSLTRSFADPPPSPVPDVGPPHPTAAIPLICLLLPHLAVSISPPLRCFLLDFSGLFVVLFRLSFAY